MHAGNIFAALMSWLVVKSLGGRMVLRIDDLDVERSKASYASAVMRDFERLGFTWDEGPYYQEGRADAYRQAFDKLACAALDGGPLVYPCFCTRADLMAASAPHRGEKLVYQGTCRNLTDDEVSRRMNERNPAWRLRVPSQRYELDDMIQGHFAQDLARECGDFIIRRSDGLFAYQLATVVDDAEEGVNLIVRGMDLLVSTPQQIYLQDLLGLGHARYAHVPLIVSCKDRRLSKRDRDAGIDELLARFKTPEGVIGHVAYISGLVEADEPRSCVELLGEFELSKLGSYFCDPVQIQWR